MFACLPWPSCQICKETGSNARIKALLCIVPPPTPMCNQSIYLWCATPLHTHKPSFLSQALESKTPKKIAHLLKKNQVTKQHLHFTTQVCVWGLLQCFPVPAVAGQLISGLSVSGPRRFKLENSVHISGALAGTTAQPRAGSSSADRVGSEENHARVQALAALQQAPQLGRGQVQQRGARGV